MTLLEVIYNNPSICFDCEHARKPAAESNLEKGYVGCCIRCLGFNWDSIIQAEEVGEGWVDLRTKPDFGVKSGAITNFQIITKGVQVCGKFQKQTN